MFRRNWKVKHVPRLEDLAFEASYRDIMNTLIACNDHCPKGSFASQKEVQFVKNHLNQYLAVKMSEKLRYNISICAFFNNLKIKLLVDFL